MCRSDNGGSAFPQHGWTNDPYVLERMKSQGGMSLRDYFAGQALAGEMIGTEEYVWHDRDAAKCAERCYHFADAMLAEKARREQPKETA